MAVRPLLGPAHVPAIERKNALQRLPAVFQHSVGLLHSADDGSQQELLQLLNRLCSDLEDSLRPVEQRAPAVRDQQHAELPAPLSGESSPAKRLRTLSSSSSSPASSSLLSSSSPVSAGVQAAEPLPRALDRRVVPSALPALPALPISLHTDAPPPSGPPPPAAALPTPTPAGEATPTKPKKRDTPDQPSPRVDATPTKRPRSGSKKAKLLAALSKKKI